MARGTKDNRLNGDIFGTRERLGMSGMRLKIGPATAASTIGATQPTKIVAQHLAALACQHAGGHIKSMVQARIDIEVVQRTQRARLASVAPYTQRPTRALTISPAHMQQGSSVT